jgi:hypothetical protein
LVDDSGWHRQSLEHAIIIALRGCHRSWWSHRSLWSWHLLVVLVSRFLIIVSLIIPVIIIPVIVLISLVVLILTLKVLLFHNFAVKLLLREVIRFLCVVLLLVLLKCHFVSNLFLLILAILLTCKKGHYEGSIVDEHIVEFIDG